MIAFHEQFEFSHLHTAEAMSNVAPSSLRALKGGNCDSGLFLDFHMLLRASGASSSERWALAEAVQGQHRSHWKTQRRRCWQKGRGTKPLKQLLQRALALPELRTEEPLSPWRVYTQARDEWSPRGRAGRAGTPGRAEPHSPGDSCRDGHRQSSAWEKDTNPAGLEAFKQLHVLLPGGLAREHSRARAAWPRAGRGAVAHTGECGTSRDSAASPTLRERLAHLSWIGVLQFSPKTRTEPSQALF